jgi:hypothetical protein
MMKRFRAWIAAVALIALIGGQLAAAQDLPDQEKALLPAMRDEIAAQTEGTLDRYRLDLTLDPAASTIGGREEIEVINDFGEPVDRLALRVYPNAVYYGEGTTTIDDIEIDGASGSGAFSRNDETVYWIELSESLADGETTTVAFDFTTVIPTDSAGTYGIFSHDTVRGTWVLADWYPIVAGYESGTDWYVNAPTDQGDPTFSSAATYAVSLDAPSGLRLASTGSVTSATDERDGLTEYEIVTGPVREFTLVLDDNAELLSGNAGDVKVNVWFNPDTGTRRGAELTLENAIASLGYYGERFGPYPYSELDLVETELGGAFGVSWSGLVFLDSQEFLASAVLTQSDPSRFAFTIAHEIGHQWWGAMIGSNSNDHTFLVEGLTNYLAIVFFEDHFGADEARRQLEIQIVQPYQRALAAYGDGVVDRPIDAPRDGPPNSPLQYGKAALGFLAIREAIGDEAFFEALTSYATELSFGVSGPADLRERFESASGKDLSVLWSFWFEQATATASDVDALLTASDT